MSHHNIRFGILIEKVRELLEDQSGRQQIKTQKEKSCRVPIQTWYTWKEYNLKVKLNKGFKDKDGNWQQEHSIPLIKINEGVYNHYLGIIKQHMERVRVNVRGGRKLCPFELIVMYYMNQITQNYDSQITMMDVYNIVDVYEKAFKHHLKGHEHCCCKETFQDNENKNSFTDYLNSHYEQMFRVDSLVQKILEAYPTMDWNADHHVKYIDHVSESRFILRSQCHFIG
jgi:hypothetical protein